MCQKFNAIVDIHCGSIKFIQQLRFVVDKQCGFVSICNDQFFATRLIPLCCLVVYKLCSAHNDTQNCGTNDHKLSEQFLIVYLGKLHQESISRRKTKSVVHGKNVWRDCRVFLNHMNTITDFHCCALLLCHFHMCHIFLSVSVKLFDINLNALIRFELE